MQTVGFIIGISRTIARHRNEYIYSSLQASLLSQERASRPSVSQLKTVGWVGAFLCAAEIAELLTRREGRLQLATGRPAVRADVTSKSSFLPVAAAAAAMVTDLRQRTTSQLAIISIYIAGLSHCK